MPAVPLMQTKETANDSTPPPPEANGNAQLKKDQLSIPAFSATAFTPAIQRKEDRFISINPFQPAPSKNIISADTVTVQRFEAVPKQDSVKPTLQVKSNNHLQSPVVQRVGDEKKEDFADIPVPARGGDEKREGTFVELQAPGPPVVREAWGAGQPAAGLGLGSGAALGLAGGADMALGGGIGVMAGDEKKQAGDKKEGNDRKVFLDNPSTDQAVVDRRKASTKESQAIVGQHQNTLGDYKSGFVKAMKKKMVDIVKDIQEKHGQMEQADNYINGDAGVNAFFYAEEKKATDGGNSEAWDNKVDKTADQRHAKLAAVAGEILDGKFKTKLVKNNRLDAGELGTAFAESKTNVTESRGRLEKTTADKAIVEMYYNELASLHEMNDKKNEGSSMIFDSDQEVREREESKRGIRDQASNIFKYGFVRQNDTKERHKEQKVVRKKLESDDRITSTSQRAFQATGMAVLNALVKTVSLGILGIRKNRDKRGFVSGVDFSYDEASERADKVKLKGKGKGGKFEITNIYNDYVFARDELKAKWAKRQPMGAYAGASLVLDGFRKFIDAIQSIFSSLSLALTAVGLIPGVAIVVAPVIAFCSSVVLAIGLAKAALSLLITLVNAVAQIENTNPELFAEMSGETAKAGINTLTDSLGIGVGAAIATSGAKGAGVDFKDKLNFNSPGYKAGPSMMGSTGDWFAKQSTAASAAIATNVIPKVTNAAVTATGNLDNNDMTYSQTINEERRIGRSKQQAKGDLVHKGEQKHIEAAMKTTKQKAAGSAGALRATLVKFVDPPPAPVDKRIPDDKKEAGNRVVEIGTNVSREAQNIGGVLDEVKDDKKRR